MLFGTHAGIEIRPYAGKTTISTVPSHCGRPRNEGTAIPMIVAGCYSRLPDCKENPTFTSSQNGEMCRIYRTIWHGCSATSERSPLFSRRECEAHGIGSESKSESISTAERGSCGGRKHPLSPPAAVGEEAGEVFTCITSENQRLSRRISLFTFYFGLSRRPRCPHPVPPAFPAPAKF